MSEQQLRAVTAGKEGAGVPGRTDGRDLEGKQGFPLDDINALSHMLMSGNAAVSEKGIVAVQLQSLPQFAW